MAYSGPSVRKGGERFIATQGGAVSMLEIAKVLKARLGERASKVPTRKLPNLVIRLGALVNVELRDLVPLLGKVRNATSAKAQRVLGWQPRSSGRMQWSRPPRVSCDLVWFSYTVAPVDYETEL